MGKKLTERVTWVGKVDWELKTFHGDELSTHRGSSYNSYLIRDKKNVLIDTSWLPYSREFVKNLKQEIDLDKIDYLPETKEMMATITDYDTIVVDLKDGFEPPVIPKLTDKAEFAGITDTVYNRFVFRIPTLQDAIRQEKYFSDSIGFWRRIAMDCLLSIERVENDEVVDTLPKEFHTWYGLKIFNEYLMQKDLRDIRTALTEYLPTLPFAYYEPCGCDEQREIPMIMEASNFFSE